MRVGVMADTHLSAWPPGLLSQVTRHLAGVDLILHAGDISNPLLFDSLEAPVSAVCGNSDSYLLAASLPGKRVLELAGLRVGLIHGHGAPEGLSQRVRRQFERVDAIIFGHSHIAWIGREDGVFMLNPGSLTRPRDGGASLAILRLGDTIDGTIIRL